MQSNSARDARRRKILERGADRLAFISGERKSFEPTRAPSHSILQDESSPVNGGFSGEIIDEPAVDIGSMNGSHLEAHQDNSKANSGPDFGVESESSTVVASDSSSLAHQGDIKRKSTSSLFTVDASRFAAIIGYAVQSGADAGLPLSDSPRECALLDDISSQGCQLVSFTSSRVRQNVLAQLEDGWTTVKGKKSRHSIPPPNKDMRSYKEGNKAKVKS